MLDSLVGILEPYRRILREKKAMGAFSGILANHLSEERKTKKKALIRSIR